jgi:hypothetical protein
MTDLAEEDGPTLLAEAISTAATTDDRPRQTGRTDLLAEAILKN